MNISKWIIFSIISSCILGGCESEEYISSDLEPIDPAINLPELDFSYKIPDHELVQEYFLQGMGMIREDIFLSLEGIEIEYSPEVSCKDNTACNKNGLIFIDEDKVSYNSSELWVLFHEYGHSWGLESSQEIIPTLWGIVGIMYIGEKYPDVALDVLGWGVISLDDTREKYQIGVIGALRILRDCEGDLICALELSRDMDVSQLRKYSYIPPNEDRYNLWMGLWVEILENEKFPFREEISEIIQLED